MLAGLPVYYFLEQAFNPRNKQMTANGKEFLLNFAKLSECDTSSCRFRARRLGTKKRCEDAPHSKSTSCETFPRFLIIRVIRG